MDKTEGSRDYFMTDVGHPHGLFKVPAKAEGRHTWGKWLGPVCAAIALSTAVALMWAGNVVQPLEATVQMERLAAKMERTKSIDAATASYIARVISQPSYDCNQIACSAQLQTRNILVRDHLKTLIAEKTLMSDVAGAKQVAPQETDAMATGSITEAGPK